MMVEPITAVAIGATIAGGATSAYGSLYGGAAKSSMFNYQAGVAKMNADIARQNAAYETAMGEINAQRQGMEGRYKSGLALADQSATGISVNRGSAPLVRESMAGITSLNQAQTRNAASRRAWNFEMEGASKDAEAAMDRIGAGAARTEGKISAAGTILGTIGSVGNQWMMGTKTGQTKSPSWADLGKFFGFGDDGSDEFTKASVKAMEA